MTPTARFPAIVVAAATMTLVAIGAASPALAVSPGTQGQPGETCVDNLNAQFEPGHAADARGSAFNENGGIAGGMYAGSQPQNSNNPMSVSQYDVACFEVTQQTH
ncbi:MAG TPA: hypothetical protein VFJ17_12440 [Mycobacteriales bacterium]|nr:hypothetical protein [Mycobacteriales bacterium]